MANSLVGALSTLGSIGHHAHRAHLHVDWNEFLLALVLVQDEALRTLPVGLAFFQGKYTANIPLLAAGALIVALPNSADLYFLPAFFPSGNVGGFSKKDSNWIPLIPFINTSLQTKLRLN